MSRVTLLMDISGRVSKEAAGYEYLTCAGVALDTPSIEEARVVFGSGFPKWVDAFDHHLASVTEWLLSKPTALLVLRIRKQEPAWSVMWAAADLHSRNLSAAAGRKAGFAKAAQFVKYYLFAECSGRLAAEFIKASGRPRILDQRGLGIVEESIICDSDIQGEDNLKVFESLWEVFSRGPQSQLAQVGLTVTVASVSCRTEQDEPLLLYPDYLAGIFQSQLAEQARPKRLSEAAVTAAREKLGSKVCVIDKPFDAIYGEAFGSSG